MDLGTFAEEVLDAVAGICGDAVVETHQQAAHVLDALCRRPGTDQRELAAVFGLTLEQLARTREVDRARSDGTVSTMLEKDPVWASFCSSDAVFTWNVLMQRINQAAHWREEFRELAMADEDGEGSGGEENLLEDSSIAGSDVGSDAAIGGLAAEASARTRERARALISKHLDPAPEGLRRHLARRLDDEIFEKCPVEKDYRPCARSIVANLRRNSMLAAGYATGRVPPEWLVLAQSEALAPRLRQMQRRVLRVEAFKEAQQDVDTAECKQKMWEVAKGTHLAPPAQFEEMP